MPYILSIAKSILPPRFRAFLKNTFWDEYALKSYAQEGEDMILHRIFETQESGFYVDVGAHHPKRFSNTYFFYKQGWRGINIDAMPGSMAAFNLYRPRDINLEMAVSNCSQELTYYLFDEPALNGFSADISNLRSLATPSKEQQLLTTQRLETILDQYLPASQSIDFLTIDVEGLDLEVLQSNNWQKYRPKAVVVEILHSALEHYPNEPIAQFLVAHNYIIYAKCVNSWIFKSNSF